jgi:hypothetical protein
LESSATIAEQRQMLDDLQEVAQALFSDFDSFRDPGFGTAPHPKKAGEVSAAPVNPNDLICHLQEPTDTPNKLGSGAAGNLSLTGILRMLFDAEGGAVGSNSAAEDGQLDEDPNQDPRPSPKTPDANGKPLNLPPIEARFRERLAAQIAIFLREMSSSNFADHCTATQMVQAVSFPLAIALRGQKRGWVTSELAETWGLEVFSILFRGTTSHSGGLLRTVAERYARDGNSDAFSDIVGDGTLWIVLVATLGNSNWHGVGTFMDKAVALREVFTSPQLLSSAHAHRVAGLLGKIRIEDARKYLAEVAPAASMLLGQIEDILRPNWKQEIQAQAERRITYKIGDLLWRENVGWAVCLAKAKSDCEFIDVRLRGVEKKVKPGFYVNVTDLASPHPLLQTLLSDLRNGLEVAMC